MSESREFGSYRLVRFIGRGGQGTVYEAVDSRLGRRVALKILDAPMASLKALERFRREAETASRIDHPGVCTVFEAGVVDENPFIAMRLVEGKTLAAVIAQTTQTSGSTAFVSFASATTRAERSIEAVDESTTGAGASQGATTAPAGDRLKRLLRIVERTARAVHAAHELGIVHRDIKPGNIMIGADENPVVLDFGLARDDDRDFATVTGTEDVVGTPAYMSPEQLTRDGRRLDRGTDIWSLGVTLYEAVTGRRPFVAPTRAGLFQAILTTEPTDARALNPSVSRDLWAVIAAAVEKDGHRRYQTAEHLANDIAAVLESRPVSVKPVGPLGRFSRWCRREPIKAALLLTLLAAIPTITALTMTQIQQRSAVEKQRRLEQMEKRERLLGDAFLELNEGDTALAVARFKQALLIGEAVPEAAIGLAHAHVKRGEAKEALAVVDRYAAVVAGRRATVRVRAACLALEGRTADSEALLKAVPEARDAIDHFLDAATFMAAGEAGSRQAFETAAACLDRAIRWSESPRLLFFLERAHAAGHRHDADDAVESAAHLRERWPRNATALFWAGFALENVQRVDEAVAAFRKATALAPEDVRSLASLGLIEVGRDEVDRGMADLRRALEIRPGMAEAWDGLGRGLIKLDRHAEAIDAFRKALQLKPQVALTWMYLGDALSKAGRHLDAAEAYRSALAIEPENYHALVNHGAALFRAKALDQADVAFRKTASVHPYDAAVQIWISLCSRARGDVAGAAAALLRALEIEPGDAHQWSNLALALHPLDRLDEAVAACRMSLALDPELVDAMMTLGALLSIQGDLRGAAAAFERAHRVDPLSATALSNLGLTRTRLGEKKAALPILRRSVELAPDDAGCWNNLAENLRSDDRHREAIRCYERAMRLEPQNTRLWTFLGYSLSAVKQVRNAESFALQATRILRSPPGEIENIDGTDFDSIVARIWVARLRGLATTEVKLFEAAVARDPGFFGRIGNGLRSAAVRATARALVATDDREVRSEENERLRRLARRWLAEKTTGLEGALMNEDLSEDEVLELAAALRDDDALRDLRRRLAESTLAADESKAWSEAWIALDHLIDKTR